MCVETGKLHHTTTVPTLKNYGNPKKLNCSYKLTTFAFFANVCHMCNIPVLCTHRDKG
jgi:hypothetical protein